MTGDIRNAQNELLEYAFHSATRHAPGHALLVIGHGVTANMDREWAKTLANEVALAGIPALRFSFSGNGKSGGRFEDSNITKEVADLGSVIDAVFAAGYHQVYYAGHSMGGAVGVIRTAKDDRIGKLISLSGMVHTGRFADTEFGENVPGASFMWDKPECPLSQAYLDDLRGIDSVINLAPSIHVPWLLVHGDADDVVPVEESRAIYARANEPKSYVELPGVDHVFSDDGLHPMTRSVVNWLTNA